MARSKPSAPVTALRASLGGFVRPGSSAVRNPPCAATLRSRGQHGHGVQPEDRHDAGAVQQYEDPPQSQRQWHSLCGGSGCPQSTFPHVEQFRQQFPLARATLGSAIAAPSPASTARPSCLKNVLRLVRAPGSRAISFGVEETSSMTITPMSASNCGFLAVGSPITSSPGGRDE